MNLIHSINRLIQPLANRLRNMVAHAVVLQVDDTKKWQRLQLEVTAGEIRDDVPSLQPFGFTSCPKTDGEAEALVVRVGGRSDSTVAILTGDRRYRLTGLAEGEVALYDATGSKFVMKANGDIEATPSSGKLKINADVSVTGKINASGDIESSGTVKGDVDCVTGSISLAGHKHTVSGQVTETGSLGALDDVKFPTVASPTGETGGPV